MCGSYLPKDDPKPHLRKRKVVIEDPREIAMWDNFRRQQSVQNDVTAMTLESSFPSSVLPDMGMIEEGFWSGLAMTGGNNAVSDSWSTYGGAGIAPMEFDFSEGAYIREW